MNPGSVAKSAPLLKAFFSGLIRKTHELDQKVKVLTSKQDATQQGSQEGKQIEMVYRGQSLSHSLSIAPASKSICSC